MNYKKDSLLIILELRLVRLHGKEQSIVIRGLREKEQRITPTKYGMYYLMGEGIIQDLLSKTRMCISKLIIAGLLIPL